MQGTQVQSLVREVTPHMPGGVAKKKKKKKKKLLLVLGGGSQVGRSLPGRSCQDVCSGKGDNGCSPVLVWRIMGWGPQWIVHGHKPKDRSCRNSKLGETGGSFRPAEEGIYFGDWGCATRLQDFRVILCGLKFCLFSSGESVKEVWAGVDSFWGHVDTFYKSNWPVWGLII